VLVSLLVVALTLVASLLCWAQQTVPNISRPVDVRIQVATPDDHAVEQAVHIELTSADGLVIDTASTGGEGFALFHRVNPGSYRAKVSGTAVETTTSDVFSISSGEGVHRELVHVKLRTPGGDKGALASAGATISASELNIPSKAKRELDKGMEAFSRGDFNKAVLQFQKAIDLYPKYSQAYYNLGVTQMKLGERSHAKDAFQKSISVNDRFAPGYINLARLAAADTDVPQAAALLNKALQIDPNNLEALVLLAKVQLMNHELDQALATARKVHGMPHEGYADVHLVAADVLVLENHPQDAIVEYETYLKEFPTSPQAPQVRQVLVKLQAEAQ